MKFFYSTIFLLTTLFTLFITTARAQQNDDLLHTLVKKNLITQQEADSIRSAEAVKEKKRLDQERENQHNITIGSRALQISGLVQARYQGFEQAGVNDAFDLHRARLDAKGNITDAWSYEIYTEFAGNNKLLDAYTAYKVADFLKLTAGQFKVPFSYESLTSDSQLDFIDRSQVIEALAARSKDVIGNQIGRDVGFQVSGSFVKTKDRYLFDYTIGVFNGAGYNVITDNNNNKDVAVRLGLHPGKGFDLGGGIYRGEDIPAGGVKTQTRNRYGFDAHYVSGRFSATAEYAHGTDAAVQRDGGYIQAGYFVLPKLQLLAKYDTYDPNKLVATDRSTIWYGGVNYVFNQWTKFEVNYLNRRQETVQVKNNILEVQMQIAF
ncbi:MAG: hypothetical protein JSU01_20350 [Bacteroidetes bacterium]|nr:hypothetical protein [Bacteroidota bacterium]